MNIKNIALPLLQHYAGIQRTTHSHWLTGYHNAGQKTQDYTLL